jgi:eukaryotic-like serine/threonine-protein kinase
MIGTGEIVSGRYLLQEELGAGGTATVYRAVDLRTGGEVAVKVPYRHLLRDVRQVERLRREAQIAATVTSPSVARVTDYAEHEGTPCLVMEYVPGETLADRLAGTRTLPVPQAMYIALAVARALNALYDRHIIHRDLKPENIRITGDNVKVIDCGLAWMEGQSRLTADGMLMGTLEYLAPERAEGHDDIRADIYSLGVTLYQMLTGRLPFTGATPLSLIRSHATKPPPPLPPGLPPAVYEIVAGCLAKRPEDRFQTPKDLVVALAAALRVADQQIAAQRATAHSGGIHPVTTPDLDLSSAETPPEPVLPAWPAHRATKSRTFLPIPWLGFVGTGIALLTVLAVVLIMTR